MKHPSTTRALALAIVLALLGPAFGQPQPRPHIRFGFQPGVSLTGAIGFPIAGNNAPADAGDGGAATDASVNAPVGLARDNAGNLYIATRNAVRKVDLNGIITALAGQAGQSGNSQDGTPANQALLGSPSSVAVDGFGNVYIADAANNAIRVIYAGGSVTGIASPMTSGDLYTLLQIASPRALTFDSNGNLFFVDGQNQAIGVIYSAGTIAGLSGLVPGQVATVVPGGHFQQVTDLKVDSFGNIYICDMAGNQVWFVSAGTGGDTAPAGYYYPNLEGFGALVPGTLYPFAGNGTPGYTGDNTTLAPQAELNLPNAIAVDSSGDVLISDSGNHVVRIVYGNEKGGGAGYIDTYLASGPYNSIVALGYLPPEVNVCIVGNCAGTVPFTLDLYLASSGANQVSRYTPYQTQFPGTAVGESSQDHPIALYDNLNSPLTVSIPTDLGGLAEFSFGATPPGSASGTPVCALVDPGNPDIPSSICTLSLMFQPRHVGLIQQPMTVTDNLGNQYLFELQGVGIGPLAAIEPPAISTGTSGLNKPFGIAVDLAGDQYIADTGNNRVVKIDTSGNLTVVAAGLNAPGGVAVDFAGDVYIADTGNAVVREIDTSGNNVIVAGTLGSAGYSGDGGLATSATLSAPTGLAFDTAGDLYIADTGNNCIREVTSPVEGNGSINTVAGPSPLNSPEGIAVDLAGDLFIADTGNGVIRRLDALTGNLTLAASGFNLPLTVTLDPAGDLFVADARGGRIAKVDAATGTVRNVVVYPNVSTPAQAALDLNGNLYIADPTLNTIQLASASNGVLVFPVTPAGQTSAAQPALIANQGNTILSLSGITPAGVFTGSNFQLFGSCSGATAIASGADCLQSIAFAPAQVSRGIYAGTFDVADNSATGAPQTIAVEGLSVPVPIAISPPAGALASVFQNAAFSQSFSASGGVGALTIQLTGVPPGLAFSGSTLSGAPTAAGSYTIRVTASDAFGDTTTQQYTLQVLSPIVPVTVAETIRVSDTPSLLLEFVRVTVRETIQVSDAPLIAAGPAPLAIMVMEAIHVADAPSAELEFVPVTVMETIHVTDAPSVMGGLLSQTINFPAPADQILGAAPFSLSATASSGLAVSFVSNTSSICTVSQGVVTLLSIGACSITASQPGISRYAAAAAVTQRFTVIAWCTVSQTGIPTVVDVQRFMGEVLGLMAARDDLNGNGRVDVSDIQIEINAALGLGCAAKQEP